MLSHPLVVDAVESGFVPLCVYNNVKGADARVLEAFGERSWNNPVTRVIDLDRKDRVPRNGSGWTVAAVLAQATRAMEARKADVPAWQGLTTWESSIAAKPIETAIFGMT